MNGRKCWTTKHLISFLLKRPSDLCLQHAAYWTGYQWQCASQCYLGWLHSPFPLSPQQPSGCLWESKEEASKQTEEAGVSDDGHGGETRDPSEDAQAKDSSAGGGELQATHQWDVTLSGTRAPTFGWAEAGHRGEKGRGQSLLGGWETGGAGRSALGLSPGGEWPLWHYADCIQGTLLLPDPRTACTYLSCVPCSAGPALLSALALSVLKVVPQRCCRHLFCKSFHSFLLFGRQLPCLWHSWFLLFPSSGESPFRQRLSLFRVQSLALREGGMEAEDRLHSSFGAELR